MSCEFSVRVIPRMFWLHTPDDLTVFVGIAARDIITWNRGAKVEPWMNSRISSDLLQFVGLRGPAGVEL